MESWRLSPSPSTSASARTQNTNTRDMILFLVVVSVAVVLCSIPFTQVQRGKVHSQEARGTNLWSRTW